MVPAVIAGACSTVARMVMLAVLAALRAMRDAIRPALLCNPGQASGVARKLIVEVPDAVAQVLGNALPEIHCPSEAKSSQAECVTCFQGIIADAF